LRVVIRESQVFTFLARVLDAKTPRMAAHASTEGEQEEAWMRISFDRTPIGSSEPASPWRPGLQRPR
jgi:hypothetical protein